MKMALILTVALLGLFGADALANDFVGASTRYGIPQELLVAISKVESGHNPLAVNRNKNGSVDLGHMQVNSEWQKSGKIEWKKLTDPEYCSNVGAWILAQELERYQGNVWAAVGAYNTGKSARDWEKYADTVGGEKRLKALNLAEKARSYARAVYAAYVKIQARKGEKPKGGWILEAKEQRTEVAQSQAIAEPSRRIAAAAPMAVTNPFGTYY